MSGWAEAVFNELVSAGVRQVAYVPDIGLKKLIELCIADNRILTVPLTTEEEGLGLLGVVLFVVIFLLQKKGGMVGPNAPVAA